MVDPPVGVDSMFLDARDLADPPEDMKNSNSSGGSTTRTGGSTVSPTLRRPTQTNLLKVDLCARARLATLATLAGELRFSSSEGRLRRPAHTVCDPGPSPCTLGSCFLSAAAGGLLVGGTHAHPGSVVEGLFSVAVSVRCGRQRLRVAGRLGRRVPLLVLLLGVAVVAAAKTVSRDLP